MDLFQTQAMILNVVLNSVYGEIRYSDIKRDGVNATGK